jgi:hypothetical protein
MNGGNEQSFHKILFQSPSISERNTGIGVKGLWKWCCEPVKCFQMVFSISRRKGPGRRWKERWPSKIDTNWGKHCCSCLFGQKWPSNRIEDDSRIFKHPKILKEDLERKLCARFVPHLNKRNTESHLAKTLSRCPMQRFKIITGDENWCFVYDPETKRQSSEWFSQTSPRLKKQIPKVPQKDCWYFFWILKA